MIRVQRQEGNQIQPIDGNGLMTEIPCVINNPQQYLNGVRIKIRESPPAQHNPGKNRLLKLSRQLNPGKEETKSTILKR